MTGCRRAQYWMSIYWDGELDDRRSARLHGHVRVCPECRARFGEAEELNGVMETAMASTVKPPEHLPDLVMAALKQEPYRPVKRQPLLPWTISYGRPMLAASLAGLAAFTLGYRPWETPEPSQSASSRSAVTTVSAPTPAADPLVETPVQPPVVSSPDPLALAPASQTLPPPTPATKDTVARLPRTQVPAPFERAKPTVAPPTAPAMKAGLPPAKTALPPDVPAPANQSEEEPAPYALASARLEAVTGTAQVRSDELATWTPLQPDSSVRMDQRVRSGQDSQLALTLDGGIELRMNAETEVVPMRSPRPDSPYWVVRLVRGELFARVSPDGSGLKVLTPAGDAVSREGEFLVKANTLMETRLLVAKGSAALENGDGRSVGEAGMQIAGRMGLPPDPAQQAWDMDSIQWAYAPLPRRTRGLISPQ